MINRRLKSDFTRIAARDFADTITTAAGKSFKVHLNRALVGYDELTEEQLTAVAMKHDCINLQVSQLVHLNGRGMYVYKLETYAQAFTRIYLRSTRELSDISATRAPLEIGAEGVVKSAAVLDLGVDDLAGSYENA